MKIIGFGVVYTCIKNLNVILTSKYHNKNLMCLTQTVLLKTYTLVPNSLWAF